jgi:tetratricopeptide (TPR) repeat protein
VLQIPAIRNFLMCASFKNVAFFGSALICLPLALAQTQKANIQPITSALNARNYEQAVQLSREALKQQPNNAQLWTLQAIAFAGKGDKESALRDFQRSLKIAPDYIAALAGTSQILYANGDAKAIPLLEHLVKLRPEDPTGHAMLAVLESHAGNCEAAVPHFEKAASVLDSQPDAQRAYGICLLELKRTDKAISVFQSVVTAHPEDPRARRGLASVYLAAGKPQDALATLRPLIDTASPEVGTMKIAAAAYEADKDTPSAVKLLREAIVRDPRNVALYVDFANIALTHQSFQLGIEMVDAGLKLQPDAAELYMARGVLYVQLAEYDKAEADFKKAEQLNPRQSMSGAAQGMVAEEKNQKDPDQALAIVCSKLAKKPGDAFLWYLKAAMLAQKSPAPGSPEFQQAVEAGKKAVALQSSLSSAHDVLAKLYLQEGQTGPAIKECRRALQDSPNDQTALYHLVLALRKTNDKTEIPELLMRLANARQDATAEEAEHNRYKLVLEPDPPSN